MVGDGSCGVEIHGRLWDKRETEDETESISYLEFLSCISTTREPSVFFYAFVTCWSAIFGCTIDTLASSLVFPIMQKRWSKKKKKKTTKKTQNSQQHSQSVVCLDPFFLFLFYLFFNSPFKLFSFSTDGSPPISLAPLMPRTVILFGRTSRP